MELSPELELWLNKRLVLLEVGVPNAGFRFRVEAVVVLLLLLSPDAADGEGLLVVGIECAVR